MPDAWEDMDDEQRKAFTQEVFRGGFGSELKARKIFSDEGFECWAFHYQDNDPLPAGGKGGNVREVDIQAHLRREEQTARDFEYHVLAEVKKGHTWILGDALHVEKFNAEGATPFSHPSWLLNTCIAAPGDSEIPRGGYDAGAVSDALVGLKLLPSHISTSLHQCAGNPKENTDDWYLAAVKVFKACESFKVPPVLLRRNYKIESDGTHAIIPVIIFDGNLLSINQRAAGGPSLEPHERALLRFAFGSPGYTHKVIFIHVVSIKGLASFLGRVRTLQEEVAETARRVRRDDPGPVGYPY